MRADKVAHHLGQRTRVVHDVAAVQEVSVAELLTGEIGGHGDDLYPSHQRRLNSRRGVLDRQALLWPNTQLAFDARLIKTYDPLTTYFYDRYSHLAGLLDKILARFWIALYIDLLEAHPVFL